MSECGAAHDWAIFVAAIVGAFSASITFALVRSFIRRWG